MTCREHWEHAGILETFQNITLQLGASSEAASLGTVAWKPLVQRISFLILLSTIYSILGMSESKTHHDIPKLKADNYYAWLYHMEMRLHKLGVWSIINSEESHLAGSTNHKTMKGWVTWMELALNEIVSAVGDSQLVHTRMSIDPNVIWERLESVHMLQGLGSIILMWQRFFQLKKSEEVTIQAHASICKYADCLTGLGDLPLETLIDCPRSGPGLVRPLFVDPGPGPGHE